MLELTDITTDPNNEDYAILIRKGASSITLVRNEIGQLIKFLREESYID